MVRNVCQANPSIRTAYPELFAVIGGKVPDYRSWFLRGGTAGQAGDEAQDSIRSHAHELTEHAHTLSIKDAASKDEVASMTPIYDTVNVGGVSGVPVAKIHFIFDNLLYSQDINVYYSCPKYGVYNAILVGRATDYKDKDFTIHCGFPFALSFQRDAAQDGKVYSCSTSIKQENQEYMCTGWLIDSPKITATLQTQNSGSSSITYVSGMKMAPGSSTVSGTTDPGGAGQTRETGGVETAPKHKFVRYFIRARQ